MNEKINRSEVLAKLNARHDEREESLRNDLGTAAALMINAALIVDKTTVEGTYNLIQHLQRMEVQDFAVPLENILAVMSSSSATAIAEPEATSHRKRAKKEKRGFDPTLRTDDDLLGDKSLWTEIDGKEYTTMEIAATAYKPKEGVVFDVEKRVLAVGRELAKAVGTDESQKTRQGKRSYYSRGVVELALVEEAHERADYRVNKAKKIRPRIREFFLQS